MPLRHGLIFHIRQRYKIYLYIFFILYMYMYIYISKALFHLESYRDWCYWCCSHCPPARCCRWRSHACVASQQRTNSPEGKRVHAYQTRPIQNSSSHVLVCDNSAHHASVVVFRSLCVNLLHNTGKAALIGGGAGQVLFLRNGWGSAIKRRIELWFNHPQAQKKKCVCFFLNLIPCYQSWRLVSYNIR